MRADVTRSGKGFLAGLCLAAVLVMPGLAVAEAATSAIPQIQAIYGGMLRAINVIPLAGSPNVSRIFASTESANSVFYADVDHSNPLPFATNVFSFHVVPDLSAAANFGTVSGIAGHPGSGKLFIADDAGLLSCSMASNTLVTNIVGQSAPPNPPGAGPFSSVLIKDNILLAASQFGNSNVLHFGTIDTTGNFTAGGGSPISIGGIIQFPQLVVNPVNRHVYIMGDTSSNINKSSTAIDILSAATTFTAIALPAEASAWNAKRIGIGPDGRLFVGFNSGDPGAYKFIAYSTNDGTSWSIVGTGMGGTSGGNVETGSDSNDYSVYFGGAMSTNKGATNSWAQIPRDQSQPPATHSNDGEVRVDPRNANVVYFTTDQGIGSTTNNCFRIFEIDNGLEAVQIQDFDMTADKNIAWTAAKSGIRRATNFQTSPQWTDAIFPNNDGAPYYSVAVDQSVPNGLTAYACNANIYKTVDGGTNWISVYYVGDGAESSFISGIEVSGNDVFVGRYMRSSYNGGLIYSANGGTNWTTNNLTGDTNGVNVNNVLLTEESGTMVAYVAAVYNTNNNTGGHVYRVTLSGSTHIPLSSDPISVRDLADDSSGGIYASGWTVNYDPVVFYKAAGSSTWTQLTTNGLPKPPIAGIGMLPAGRGPIITVGVDASSNDVPILASGVTLYYLPSGGTEWLTSDEMRYPEGTQLNVLYWDALLVGTDTGLYGQELGLQPATAFVEGDIDGDRLADPYWPIKSNIPGQWTFWLSSGGYLPSGPYTMTVPGGEPVRVADFDGDGLADPVMVANGGWTFWFSSGGYLPSGPYIMSVPGGDPVGGDFDGDRLADPTMVATGAWTLWLSSIGYLPSGPYIFSVSGTDVTPLAGDFDGDRLADPVMVANGAWTLWLSSGGYLPSGPYIFSVPGTEVMPMTGDFDGDGLADPVMVVNHNWTLWLSSGGYLPWGPYAFVP